MKLLQDEAADLSAGDGVLVFIQPFHTGSKSQGVV